MLLSVAVLMAAVGRFEGHADVGGPKLAGSAAYNAATQEYSMSAAGTNMWAQRDEFHFAWKKLTGDFILQARVALLGTGVDPHRKLGLIVRRFTLTEQGSKFVGNALYAEVLRYDARTLGPRFDVPFFIFNGDKDLVTPIDLAQQYFEAIEAPQKAFVVLDGGGHSAMLTMPDRFLNELVTRVRPLAVAP